MQQDDDSENSGMREPQSLGCLLRRYTNYHPSMKGGIPGFYI